MSRILTAALIWSAAAGAAFAQAPDAETARAHADAVIARSGAGAWFVNATTTEMPQVRHVPSGLLCTFPAVDDRDAINLYPVQPDGPPAGEDVGCAAWWDEVFISMIVTRYPQQRSEEDLFASAVGDIHRAWQNVEPIAEFDTARVGDQPEPRAAAFTADRNGNPATNVVVLRNIDGWTFKARGTGSATDPDTTVITTFAFAIGIPGGWDAFTAGQ